MPFVCHRLPALLGLLVFMPTVFGQGVSEIRGKITDETNAVLENARVRLVSRSGSLELYTVSDGTGAYRFAQLPGGDYLMEVEYPHLRKTVREVGVRADQTMPVDIQLHAAGVNEEITVTGAGTPQSADETAKSLSTLTEQELEQRAEYSVIEALRAVPGLRVQSLGGPGSFSKIFMRGLRVVDTSVTIDGFRLRDASDPRGSVNPFLQDLLVNNIERIEVLRGSGSALYGSNAVGGVVNLIPRQGSGPIRGSFGFEGGSLSFLRARAALSGGLRDRFSYSLEATRIDTNKGLDGEDKFRNTTLGGRAGYHLKPNIQVRTLINFGKSFLQINDTPFPIGPPQNPFGFVRDPGTAENPVAGFVPGLNNPDSLRDSHIFLGGFSFTHQVHSAWGYSARYHAVSSRRFFSNGPRQHPEATRLGIREFPSVFDTAGRIHTVKLNNNLSLGRHHLVTAGLEAERESFVQRPRGADRQGSLAFFAQDQLRFLEGRLQLAAAARVHDSFIRNPQTVPEIRGVEVPRAITADGSIAYFFPATGTKWRAHIGNSFRAPSLPERFQFFRGERIGNPFLRPERAISADGGFDQLLWRERLRFGATYFYSRLQEVIVFTTFLRQRNEPGALARGFELEANLAPWRGLEVSTSYTFTNAKQILGADRLTSANVILSRGSAIRGLSIPRHNFNLQINKGFPKGLNVHLDFAAISDYVFPLFEPVRFSQVLFTLKGHRKADLGLSYTRKLGESAQMTLYGKVDNVFNHRYFEDGFRAPGALGLGGIKFGF